METWTAYKFKTGEGKVGTVRLVFDINGGGKKFDNGGGGGNKFDRGGGGGKTFDKGGGGNKLDELLFKFRVSKLGGDAKLLLDWDGEDKGKLLKLYACILDWFYSKSSSAKRSRNFLALNYLEPKYGGNLAFL